MIITLRLVEQIKTREEGKLKIPRRNTVETATRMTAMRTRTRTSVCMEVETTTGLVWSG